MLSDRELQFALLDFLRQHGRKHKRNTVGRSSQRGDLEYALCLEFDDATRAHADYAWERLQRADLIRSDYSSLSEPEQWVEITPAGSAALERHALDDLDVALAELAPTLVHTRDQAWAALDQPGEAAVAQAASSMCELIDQTLHAGAPDSEIRSAAWFQPDKSARSGITRRHRARFIMEHRHGDSDDDLCGGVLAAHDVVAGLKHSRKRPTREDGVSALQYAEAALREMLMWVSRRPKPVHA